MLSDNINFLFFALILVFNEIFKKRFSTTVTSIVD